MSRYSGAQYFRILFAAGVRATGQEERISGRMVRLNSAKKEAPPELRVGILVIGSLLWDIDSERVDWRHKRLDVNRSRKVLAPIRYGRLSQSRSDTFTMVISKLCDR